MFIGNAGGDFGETIIRARDADDIIAGGMEVCQMHRLHKKRSLWIRIGSDSVFDLMVNNEIQACGYGQIKSMKELNRFKDCCC